MRNDQKSFLKARLNQAFSAWRSRIPGHWTCKVKPSEPANVRKAKADMKRAQAILDKWEDQRDAARTAAMAKLDAEHRKAQEALLFGDAKLALAAVEAFERKIPAAPK